MARSRLWEVLSDLVDTAMGRKKADLVLRGGNLVNVFAGEVLEGLDVAVSGDRIALVGDASRAVGPETVVVDVSGSYLAPGFVDAHVHVESSMVTLTQFARAVLPRGTTAAFIDPHEIANVLGERGVRLMLEEARDLPLKAYVAVPSCVPASSPDLETSGASLGPAEVAEMLGWEGVAALGEVMNYPGVLAADPGVLEKVAAALRAGKVVEGHYLGDLGAGLQAYAAAGISSCHESTTAEEGLAKLRAGMYLMVREGSAWRDLSEVIRVVTELGVDPRRVVLVSDDRHPGDLLSQGHVDHLLRRAVEEGVDPIRAIQMVTLNPAEHFRVDGDIGAVAPGRIADVVVLPDLRGFRPSLVVADGRVVAREGRLLEDLRPPEYPAWARDTVRLPRGPEPGDFRIPSPVEEGPVRLHVVGVVEASALTRHLVLEAEASGGEVRPDPERDLAAAAVIERHGRGGGMGLGFVTGFGFSRGAVASTVAHDSHNLVVVGYDPADMAAAAGAVAEVGGGQAVVDSGRVLARVALPIAGLMSDRPVEEVAREAERLEEAWRSLGCSLVSPFMTLSLLALSVIPELRVTDRGVVDAVNFRPIPAVEPA